jgi:hypothetical protein
VVKAEEHLPGKYKALSSNPRTSTNENKGKSRIEQRGDTERWRPADGTELAKAQAYKKHVCLVCLENIP